MAMVQFNWRDDTLIEFSILFKRIQIVRSHFGWQMSTALLFDNWIRNFHPVDDSRAIEDEHETSAAHFMKDKTDGNRCTWHGVHGGDK